MNISFMAVLGIAAVFLALQLKALRPEYSLYLILAASVIIALFTLNRITGIEELIRTLLSEIQLDSFYLRTLLKMIGIAYIAEFTSGLCQDAGYKAIGTQIELFGKILILTLSLPILEVLLETLNSILS